MISWSVRVLMSVFSSITRGGGCCVAADISTAGSLSLIAGVERAESGASSVEEGVAAMFVGGIGVCVILPTGYIRVPCHCPSVVNVWNG